MKNIIIGVFITLCLSACKTRQTPEDVVTDQCKRAKRFDACIKNLPAGPKQTKYNDWAEVVEECEGAAYWQSQARRKNVEPECSL